MSKLIVSPAPHIHGAESTGKIMRDVLIALAPSVLAAVYFYGLRAIMLLAVAVITCVGVEFLIQKYMLRTRVTVTDLSAAVTGVLLALNLPPTAPWWIAVIGSAVAIGVAKMTFGGLGHNIFNPALVGRVFLLISFPVIMTDWTVPASCFRPGIDAVTGATPLALINEGLAQGLTVDQIMAANPSLTYGQMLFARAGGSAGEVSALAVILGFVYLLVRRVIRPHIPVTIVLTVAVMTGIFWLIDPQQYTDPLFNILTGGLLLGSVFMATDYVTSPMTTKGMIIYGIGIGVITVLIRFFGSYPEGVSFAILIMNSIVPLLNKYIKPARFGKEVSHA
ncbi:MAG TPA: RnfABCDGE type electron transport complex subunit D [Candidatus Coprenecus stercoravium]|uniref:Ion-translocating oxidoreductase complex subunit D n=1 Tax=Candidatus Coprenecus stercoravium TaxID=2840735 RepID=A0A9D2GSK3_9BACT|nr:RnfABCDGE type electron transport complex subunit D [Candidatus Coprenecus stercoravium]